MDFSEKEKAELKILCQNHPIVKKLYEELQTYEEDPTKIFYIAVTGATKKLSNELKLIARGEFEDLPIFLSDDKLFERINTVIKESEKYFKGINIGRAHINPEEEKAGENERGII